MTTRAARWTRLRWTTRTSRTVGRLRRFASPAGCRRTPCTRSASSPNSEDDPAGLDRTRRGAQMERTLREAAAAGAEVEAAVLRGLADAKARAGGGAPRRRQRRRRRPRRDGDDHGRPRQQSPEGETSKPAEEEDGEEEGSDDEGEEEEASRTSTNAGDSTNGGPEVSASLALDAPDGPAAVSSDGGVGVAPRKRSPEERGRAPVRAPVRGGERGGRRTRKGVRVFAPRCLRARCLRALAPSRVHLPGEFPRRGGFGFGRRSLGRVRGIIGVRL